MADTQQAPHPATQPTPPPPGSMQEATDVFLDMMEPEEDIPEIEEEQSTEEEDDESVEEESESDEEDDESEESEEETEESEEPELFTVKVGGEEFEVTLDELAKGYSRQSDYTKKTQELSEHRKGFDDLTQKYNHELQSIQGERQQYINSLEEIINSTSAKAEEYGNIDWEKLKEEDPIEYFTKRDEINETRQKVIEYRHQQEQAQKVQSEKFQESFREWTAGEVGKLQELIPEFSNPDSSQKVRGNLREYATAQSFSPEEIGNLVDSRQIHVLYKAMKYDELQKADVKTKKVKNKPKVVKAGRGAQKGEGSKVKRTKQLKRLQASGRIDDAVHMLEDHIFLE
jgi:hypothetical protein